MKNILVLVCMIGLVFSLSGCKLEKTEEIDPEITKFIESQTNEKFVKIKDVHENILDRLKDMNDEYEDVLSDLEDDESEENIKNYKKVWSQLGGISLYFDTNIKAFPRGTFSQVNKKIVAIDDIMREKGDSGLVGDLIDEIEDILDAIQKEEETDD